MGVLVATSSDNFVPEQFSVTEQIDRFHKWDRHGHTNDISVLWTDGGDQQDYVVGIIVGSLIILSVFVVWSLVLVILKMLGKRVGCASGKPRRPPMPKHVAKRASHVDWSLYATGEKMDVVDNMTETEKNPPTENADSTQQSGDPGTSQRDMTPSYVKNDKDDERTDEEYDQAMDEWRRKVKRFERRLMLSRTVFLISGLMVIVASILFIVQGVDSLINSLNDGSNTVAQVESIINQGIETADDFLEGQAKIRNATDSFWDTRDENSSAFCENVTNDTAISEIRNLTDEIGGIFRNMTDFLAGGVEDLRVDLVDSLEMTQSVDNTLQSFKGLFIAATVVMSVLDLLVLALMVSVVMAWMQHQSTFLKWMRNIAVLPIFLFFLFVFWLFACLFLIMSVGGSDWCIDPDEHTGSLLVKNKDKFESIIFSFLVYYISGCEIKKMPPDFEEMASLAAALLKVAHQLVHTLKDLNPKDYPGECGNAVEFVTIVADRIHVAFHFFHENLEAFLDIFSCSNFNPLYTGVMYDAVCVHGVNGLTWIFSTALCMAVCSMIMVTLRASWYEVEMEEEEANALAKASSVVPGIESSFVDEDKRADLDKNDSSNEPVVVTGIPAEDETRESAIEDDKNPTLSEPPREVL